MKFKRTTIVLVVVALFAGLGASFGAKNYISKNIATYKANIDARYEKVRIVVARGDFPAGTVLNASSVSIREIPRAFLHNDAITEQRWDEYNGRSSLVAVSGGAPLLRSQIDREGLSHFSRALTDGKRALTIPVDQVTSLAGMLSPGDRVDILFSISAAQTRQTTVLMTDIPILATGRQTGTDPRSIASRAQNGYATVTVLVDTDQAAKLVHAREEGSLSVVMRGDSADTQDWPDSVTLASLLGEPEKKPAPVKKYKPGIEVILGGANGARNYVQ